MVSERLSVYLHNSLAGYLWLSDTNRYSFQTERDYTALPESELENIITKKSMRPVLVLKDELRLSLAGAQNKIPVYIDNDRFYLTTGIAPSSHILKPPSPFSKDF